MTARSDYPVATLELNLDDDPTANYTDAVMLGYPLGYYRLDEASGSLTDSSGNARTLTVTNSGKLVYAQPGALSGDPDTAVNFNNNGAAGGSTGGWAQSGTVYSLTNAGYSFEGWIKRRVTGVRHPVARISSGTGFYVFVDTDDKLKVAWDAAADGGAFGGSYRVTSSVTIDTAWHHFAYVFVDNATQPRLYIDSVDVTVIPATGLGSGVETNQRLGIAIAGTAAGTVYFDGFLDELALYPVAPSAAQVAAHYRSAAIHNPLSWTDATAYFVGGDLKRGRQHELNAIQAGTASIKLQNTDRRFDPTHVAGPYYGKLLPMRRARLRWTISPPPSGFYRDRVLAGPPLIYWRMNETSGTVLTDSSGNGHTGTLAGGGFTYLQAGGLVGDTDTAIKWPAATGSYAIDGGPFVPLVAGNYTLEILFKRRTASGHRDPLIFCTPDFNTGPYLYIDTDDKLKLSLGCSAGGAGTSVVIASSVTVADTNYHSAVFSANGGRLFLDGVLVGAAGGATAGTAGAAVTIVGAGVTGGSATPVAGFDGTLDEAAVYLTALSDEDVLTHYRGATTQATYTRFQGFVERFPLRWSGPSNAWVELTVVDGFEQLAQTDISDQAWPSETVGARINHVLDAVLWPRSLRAIDAGDITVPATAFDPAQFTSALAHLQAVADSDLGYYFHSGVGKATYHDRFHRSTYGATSRATFGDANSGFLPYTELVPEYSKDHVLNDVTTTADGGTPQRAQDGTSIAKYFRRSVTRTGLFTSDAEALAQSQIILSTHKEPGLRIEQMTQKPSTAASWAQVLGREIGDRVTVRRSPPGGGSPIVQACYVESMEDSFPRALEWQETWQMTPADASTFWVLGDPALGILGSTTRLA